LSEALERTHTLEQSGDLYFAWFEYRQEAQTFENLGDTAPLLARAAALENEKTVREGARREKRELEEQRQLESPISAGLAALGGNDLNRTDTLHQLAQAILDLRSRADHEKRTDKLRVVKRALTGVLVEAMETGAQQLDANAPPRGQDYFELALDADPDSIWALSNLAAALSLNGNRKGALDALRRAKTKTKDPARFVAWLNEEPAFTKLRGTPEFAALLVLPAPQ
jgi:tetratricopeptide (TPR) repeat protein